MKKQYNKPVTMQILCILPAQMLASSSTYVPIGGEGDFSVKEDKIFGSDDGDLGNNWEGNEW